MRRLFLRLHSFALVLASLVLPAFADEPDAEEKAENRVLIERVIRENCLICHSSEMIEAERLTPAQWKTEVEKMVGWGAPLPADAQAPVIAFLAARYATTTPVVPPARMHHPNTATSLDKIQGDVPRGATLYAENCANCHGVDAQGAELGTNLAEKPALLVFKAFDEVVRDGRGRMPGFRAKLTAHEARDMLAWLRGRRYKPLLPKPN